MSGPLKESSSTPASVTARLSALYEFWPAPVRQEIIQSNWSDASVALPMKRLEAVIKTGRVVFTWGELIQWLDVPPSAPVSPHGETAVELPLPVIVPLFMAQKPAPLVQSQISLGAEIPNLFAGMG